MTFKVWLVLFGILGIMGLMEGIASLTSSGLSSDVDAGFTAVSGGRILNIDDAELSSGPLNVDFSFGIVFSRTLWGAIFNMLTWDFSWFQGDLNVVRWALFGVFTSTSVVLFAMNIGGTLLGAIRGR